MLEGLRSIAATLLPLLVGGLIAAIPTPASSRTKRCVSNMAMIDGTYCIDRWEAGVEEQVGRRWRVHSPYDLIEDSRPIRATSRAKAIPQGYINQEQARFACENAGKTLCTGRQWLRACAGPQSDRRYPYGSARVDGACNDAGVSAFGSLFPAAAADDAVFNNSNLNDSRINRTRGTIARTGSFGRCKSPEGVFDLTANVAEWTSDRGFRGGFYLSATNNHGVGCFDGVVGHSSRYHDYSTGFRCCANPR